MKPKVLIVDDVEGLVPDDHDGNRGVVFVDHQTTEEGMPGHRVILTGTHPHSSWAAPLPHPLPPLRGQRSD